MEYEVIIGLEVHVQINTDSKLFCSCPNKYGEEPNNLVCPICMGYPGVLPTPNRKAIRKTIAAGLMCNCEISKFSKFDRKSYFYPDMPKNYQISQYDLPFCTHGRLHIEGVGFSGNQLETKNIGIGRIHLEEDVAKSIHFSANSGIDFNRAGVPLMEIVSEPDMKSADEAHAYLVSLKEIMQFGEIGNCNMEKGQMRCDVNISVKPKKSESFGTKIEIKNLNSFRAVHNAIDFETERQMDIIKTGNSLTQETRGWDAEKGETYLMRTKESAHDYRYFPDPDLMPIEHTQEEINEIKDSLPESPTSKRIRFIKDYGLPEYDAKVLTSSKNISEFFDKGARSLSDPKSLANWIITELLRELSNENISINESRISPEDLVELINLINDGTITGKIAKKVFKEMFKSGEKPKKIVKNQGLIQVSDEQQIESYVKEVLENNNKQVEQYKAGKESVLQFFVGQVMKISKGKANPQIVKKILKENLDK